MMDIKTKINMVLDGGQVQRFHTRSIIKPQDNAQHQYGVTSIAALLDPELHKDSILNFLWHDVHEVITGDIPYQAKKRWAALNKAEKDAKADIKLSFIPDMYEEYDKITFKIAEYLDVMFYSMREESLGNTEFKDTIQECAELVYSLLRTYPNTVHGTNIVLITQNLLREIFDVYHRFKSTEKTNNTTNYLKTYFKQTEELVQDEIIQ